jgi:molybdate transport system permease protein
MRAARPKIAWFPLLLAGALALALVFLTLPIAAIFLEAGPGELISSLGNRQALDALGLSLLTSSISLAIIVAIGTPSAYLLATRSFRARGAIMTLIELPLVVPPAVAGIGLLAAFGPSGLLGGPIGDLGIDLVFETAGVIVALTFVASPFYMRQAQAAFEAVDADWLGAARTLGATEARAFISVAVPAAAPGLLAGGALAWGRALGEFGATIIFAGSLQGVTQTAPLAILELFASDFDAALALSAVLVALSAALLATIKLFAPSDPTSRARGRNLA